LSTVPQTEITECIVAKVSHNPVRFGRKSDYVLLTDRVESVAGYAAVVTARPDATGKIPIFRCDEEQLQTLNDGDVVSIDKSGRVSILYETRSEHNSLLVTERCNCSCIMCPQTIDNQEEDKTELILRILSLIGKEARTLGITGGEPTLLGEGLIDIVKACKVKLPRTGLMLLSNGIRFQDFQFVKSLMLVGHPDLTIDIPLYSDTDTEHNHIVGAKGFYRTIAGLYNLARFNQRIGIRVVVHRLTYSRLPQLAEFLYHNFPFVFHIAFMQMETINLARENIGGLWIDPYDYNEQLEEAVFYLWRRGMSVSIYNAQLCVLPKNLWQFARKSISSWKDIYVEECSKCAHRADCGGLFESSSDLYSRHLKALES
jgi:His-Xaa-Ser system radical SAM maturase HxsC